MTCIPTRFSNEPPAVPLWDYEVATDTFRYLTNEDIGQYHLERAAYWMLRHAIPALMELSKQIVDGEADYRFSPAKMIKTGPAGYKVLVDAGLIDEKESLQ